MKSKVLGLLGKGGDGIDGCHAIVGEDKPNASSDDEVPFELCGGDQWGRGIVNGCEIKYCRKHVPSDAIAAGGRWESVEFYIPEEERRISVD